MTLGILCTVALGTIALWQAVVAAAYRRVSTTAYADGHRAAATSWQTAIATHEAYHHVLVARHNTFVAGIQRCLEPGIRRDARAMHQAIHDAAVAANKAAEVVRADAVKAEMPSEAA